MGSIHGGLLVSLTVCCELSRRCSSRDDDGQFV